MPESMQKLHTALLGRVRIYTILRHLNVHVYLFLDIMTKPSFFELFRILLFKEEILQTRDMVRRDILLRENKLVFDI